MSYEKETRKVSELKLWDKNPRGIKEKDFERLKKQIQDLGQYKPLIITEDGTVLGGNMRLRAYQELNIDEVWVSVVDAPDDKTKLEYALSDNDRVGYYEDEALAELVLEVPDFELDDFKVDIKDPVDLSSIVDQFRPVEEDEELPEPPEEPVSKEGEVYQLGKHRLLCGDATKAESYQKLLGDKKADMVFTDPPYDIEANRGGQGFGGSGKGDYELEVFPEFDQWIPLASKFLKDNKAILVFENYRNTVNLWKAFEENGITVKNLIIWWAKNRFNAWTPGNFFNVYDICLAGSKGKSLPINKPAAANVKDVIEHPVQTAKSGGQSEVLGTKPIPILTPYIRSLTNKGALVLEPFGGSGSTLIACEKLGRVSYVLEINPRYCDIIRQRYARTVSPDDWEERWEEITPLVE